MHKAIEPVCFTVMGGGRCGDQYATVRLTGNNIKETMKSIEDKWQNFTTQQPFQYDFFHRYLGQSLFFRDEDW